MRISEATLKCLTDIAKWQASGPAGEPISLLDYVGLVGTPDMFFAFAELYLPSLVVHAGCRFLESGFSADAYNSWIDSGVSPLETQKIMNHVHISTIFQNQEISEVVAVEAARVLGELWERTLGPQGLQVGVSGSSLEDAAVTFWERGESSPMV